MAFCQPCQTVKVHYKACGVSNRGVQGAKLLPMIVSACPVDYVTYLRYSIVVCVLVEGVTRLQLPTPSHPTPYYVPWYILAVKKVALKLILAS